VRLPAARMHNSSERSYYTRRSTPNGFTRILSTLWSRLCVRPGRAPDAFSGPQRLAESRLVHVRTAPTEFRHRRDRPAKQVSTYPLGASRRLSARSPTECNKALAEERSVDGSVAEDGVHTKRHSFDHRHHVGGGRVPVLHSIWAHAVVLKACQTAFASSTQRP
jgi:hypothetical protein